MARNKTERRGDQDGLGWFALIVGVSAIAAAAFAWLALTGRTEEALRSTEMRLMRTSPLERPQIPDQPIDVPGGRR
jgi:hypothetical protein